MSAGLSRGSARTVGTVGSGARWLERHWLLALNLIVALGIGGTALAPLFRALGWKWPATLAYLAYRPMCPQRPDHSFYLFGYKMALEQRMLALAVFLLLGGLLFAPLRRRLRPLDWRWVVVAAIPTLIDVLSQTIGLRDSTWQWRVATALPFSLAVVWWVYPYVERAVATEQRARALLLDARRTLERGAGTASATTETL